MATPTLIDSIRQSMQDSVVLVRYYRGGHKTQGLDMARQMPYYHLYDAFVEQQVKDGFKLTEHSHEKFYKDIRELFQRIKVLMSYGCVGYVMRHEDYHKYE